MNKHVTTFCYIVFLTIEQLHAEIRCFKYIKGGKIMKMTLNFISSTVVTFLIIIFMPGIEVGSIWTAILLAILLGIFNIAVKPGLEFLSIIPTLLTILLFLLVANGSILIMADWLMDSFKVNSFGTTVIFSVIVTVSNWMLHRFYRKLK